MRKGMSCSEAGKLGGIAFAETAQNLLQDRIEEYNKNPKLCKECNNSIDYKHHKEKIFCSHACSAKSSNRNRAEKRFCAVCNIHILTKKFCSKKCEGLFKNKQTAESGKSARACKVYLINKFGNVCMKCGWCEVNPTLGKSPIELNHIDGNSENNDWSNLELLCPNCHSLTPTYKFLNAGKGRFKRAQRYREGKSY